MTSICICEVYKSEKLPELYLYVTKTDGLERVPEELLERFGEPVFTLSFNLTEDRKLAREDTKTVIKNLQEQGYHLQLPPQRVGGLGKPATDV